MHTTIVELDALSDPVRATAQHHHLAARAQGNLVLAGIGRIIVSSVLHAANRNRFPGLHNPQCLTPLPHLRFRYLEELGEIAIRKSILFGLNQQGIGQILPLAREQLLLEIDQFLHLLKEPGLDVGPAAQILHACTLTQRFIQQELTFAGRLTQTVENRIQTQLGKILCESKSVTARLQRPDRLVQSLFIGFANAHDLADRLHLGSQLVL